jgi:hypothetical protein
MKKDLIISSFACDGYAILPEVSLNEEKWLYNFVEKNWLQIIYENFPKYFNEAENLGLVNYHEISYKLEHSTLWIKNNRIFSKINTQELIKNLSVFRYLDILFDNFLIADMENIGFPEIYWRLVRPNSINDVAIAHKDTWFFSSTHNLDANSQIGLAKVWLPVCIENSISGLSVCPKSHKIDIPFSTEIRHGRLKPTCDETVLNTYPMRLLELKPGQAVLFDRNLLHKGIAHQGTKTRVSIEFAVKSTNIA